MNIKSILKFIKLNESNISMALGAIVLLILGVVVVNYVRSGGSQSITEEAATSEIAEAQPTIRPGMGPVEYKVSEGETLWSIAEKQYGTGYNWVDIMKENGLTNPNEISEGSVLTIPDIAQNTVQNNDNAMSENSEKTESNYSSVGKTYTVVRGDNLWNIAKAQYNNGYMWTKIARENHLTNPNLIHAGNVLTIPKD